MYFSSILLLAATSLASPLVARGAASIVQSVDVIESRITTLNNTLNTLDGNPLTSLPTILKIQSQTDDLGDAISAATTTANKSAKLSSGDSSKVATAVINLLPNIQSLLNNLIAHKPQFDKAILGVASASFIVEKDLKKQLNLSNSLSDAIVRKLSPSYAKLAPIITNQIKAAFENAIKVFSKSGGIL